MDSTANLRTFNFSGGSLQLTGSSTAAVDEQIGSTVLRVGLATLRVDPGLGGSTQLTLNTLGSNSNQGATGTGGTMVIRSANLGGVAGPGMANIFSTNFNLIGGGAAAGL